MKLIFFSIFLICSLSNAQTSDPAPVKCLKTEGKSLGCVPSAFDTCHSGQPANCEVARLTAKCLYVQALDKYWVDPDGGPLTLQCAAYDNTECPTNPGSDISACPQATCIKYKKPVCKKKCKVGYKGSIKEVNVARKGCKRFCGEFCPNEPTCDICDPATNPNCNPRQVCPVTSQGHHPIFGAPWVLPRPQAYEAWKPDTSPLCAEKVKDPLGEEHEVDQNLAAREAGCPSTTIEPETRMDTDESCPWIKYPGKPDQDPAKDGCNPNNYGAGNLFPTDCTVLKCGEAYCNENPGKCK
ncbi:MAG: hypothetical protein IPM57_12215 [Oligoflexia bacterium]|nr:hypothetical protein [Oligoflexia bacterium]